MRPFIVKNALSEQTLNFITNLDTKWKKSSVVANTHQELYDKIIPNQVATALSKDRRCWEMTENFPTEILKELEYIFKKTPSKIIFKSGMLDCNLLEYRGEDMGCFTEHQDVYYDDTDVRKLSMTIQLSNSNDYEGGQFAIMGEQIPLEKNDAVIFPSFLLHEVLPITKGTRKVLIAWALGPLWE